VMLEGMARAGAGHFYYVETAVQIADCLTSELGEALEIVARDVTVTIQVSDGVAVTTLNRFPVRDDGAGRFSVRLGDLASRQDVELVLRLGFPTGTPAGTTRAIFSISDTRAAISEPETDTIWTYADHQANDAQRRNVVVDRVVAKLYAAQAVAEALELNRAGEFEKAAARLRATAKRIEGYAGNDPELREILDSLRQRDESYSAPLQAMYSKSQFFDSSNVSKMRSASGKAKRRPTA
jgi:Ca-activated chloride channel family protein